MLSRRGGLPHTPGIPPPTKKKNRGPMGLLGVYTQVGIFLFFFSRGWVVFFGYSRSCCGQVPLLFIGVGCGGGGGENKLGSFPRRVGVVSTPTETPPPLFYRGNFFLPFPFLKI